MSLDLTKGQRLDLTKTNPSLKVLGIGLGWDVNSTTSNPFDLDAFALALENGKVKSAPDDVLYFGSPKKDGKPQILNGALVHSGDNLTGVGEGDDETILIDLSKIPAEITEVMVCVNIYQAVSRRQNFGQVNNAFIRAYDSEAADKKEICKYDLSEDYSAFNAMVLGKVYLKDGEWRFQAVGEGKNGDINEVASLYK